MNIKRPLILSPIIIFLLFFNKISIGEIYTWKDESGKIHFSDKSPRKNSKKTTIINSKYKKSPDIYFPFNNSIKDHGPYKLGIENHLKNFEFSKGKLGKSLFIDNEGGWIDVILDKKLDFSKGFEIELAFKPIKSKSDNKNPIETLIMSKSNAS